MKQPDSHLSEILPWLAALVVIILAVFAPTLHSDFVYDSVEEIGEWNFIHEPGHILTPLTFQLMGLDVIDFNRPVGVTFLMFESMLWGKNPFGYHLGNMLLHATTACLVFLLIRRIVALGNGGGNPAWRDAIAFLAAVLFALHPLVTEPICEPSYCKDLLAAFFGLTALLVAMRHDPLAKNGAALRMFLVPLLCLLAIGSKEVGVAFPAILFLYWILFRFREPRAFWMWVIIASFGVDLVFLVARFALAHHPSEIFLVAPSYPDGSLGAALLIQPRIFTVYLLNLFWPAFLCADDNGYSIRWVELSMAVLVLALVVLAVGWWAWKDRRVLFAAGFAALCLLPTSNLVPIYHPMADRYMYLPLLGGVLLLAVALDSRWLIAKSSRQIIAVNFVVVVISILIPVTVAREHVWSSSLALWQDTLARNPESFSARMGLPIALLEAGRVQDAREQSEAALATPYSSESRLWLTYALELNRLGDRGGAESAARRALQLWPDLVDADKMTRNLQVRGDLAQEFAKLAAGIPQPTRYRLVAPTSPPTH